MSRLVIKVEDAAATAAPRETTVSETGPAASRPSSGGWVVIVGASSAIGRALAKTWAFTRSPSYSGESGVRHGAHARSNIILAGRDPDDLNRSAADLRIRYGVQVEVIAFDALAFDTHETFWKQCQARAGGAIAGIIVLHGQMPPQSLAQGDPAVARQVIDANFTSAVTLLTLAANDFEARRSGFICVFSSVAGDRGRMSNYVYGSSKAALSAFLSGLRSRMFKVKVNVLTVKPGFVDTAMTWGLPGMFLVATPEQVAADVHRAVIKGRSELYTPWFWRYIMLIIKSVPEFVFKRTKL